MRKIFERDQENCKSKCRNSHEEKDCCYLNCIYRETGIIFDGVFHEHALLKLYENYLKTEGAGKYDEWITVVEKNIKKCSESSKTLCLNDVMTFWSYYFINI